MHLCGRRDSTRIAAKRTPNPATNDQDSCPRTLDFLIALIQSICLVTRLHSLHDRVLHGTYYIKLQFPRATYTTD